MTDLIIWFQSGSTSKFENVTKFKNNDNEILFFYDGVATGKHCNATFEKRNVSGFALSVEAATVKNGDNNALRSTIPNSFELGS
ncbi:hypothetical protein ACFQ5M_02385 [Agrilactobacillus yilanensis]|uniref:Uncharacterized protein n=1 Tax=Agrilactobacillus yilanensis TaxID=2485997 RepID=A0ABW4J5M6_9LACO|nr:hypothetical protein [Agrilactobacillus yilanensis]